MKRVIFSLYIDIPEDELDQQPPHFNSTISKTLHTKQEFAKHYDWLLQRQKDYCAINDIDYKLYVNDEKFKEYKLEFEITYPQITSYNIVNFYKIQCLYDLLKEYDEVLYLDFDVIPVAPYNFFDHWDLDKGICILSGTQPTQNKIALEVDKIIKEKIKLHSNRSPIAKYWNTHAMLAENNLDTSNCDVFNTGIIGINKKYSDLLNYFNKFSDIIEYMDYLKNEELMYPSYIQNLFGYDNETIWAYKMLSQNIQHQSLGDRWHYFMDKWSYIPDTAIFVHCIKKDFDYVREWYEKNNIFDLFR